MAKLKKRPSRYWDLRAFFNALYYKLRLLSLLSLRERDSLARMWDNLPDKPTGLHLDLACGTNPLKMKSGGLAALAADRSLTMLKYARRNNPQTVFIAAAAQSLPLKNQSIALITTVGLTEYLENPQIMLQEAARILLPGGVWLFTFSHGGFFNFLRKIYNPTIYLRNSGYWREQCGLAEMEIISERKLLLQTQFLGRKA